jgi:hypothetical protein
MYKLYTDKQEVFECSIELHGASLSKSQARLVIESEDLIILFKGSISEGGKCTIPVKKLRGLLEENTKGTIKLEVIADDVYFCPWQSDFAIETSKKVTVEVTSQQKQAITESSKPSIKVNKISQQPTKKEIDHVVNIVKLLVKEDINIKNIAVRKNKVNNVVATYLKSNKVDKSQTSHIIEGIIKKLS